MNDRNATGTLTEQGPPVTAIAHGAKERLSLLWIFYMFNAAYIDITTLYYSLFIIISRPFITLKPSCWAPAY